MNLFRNGKPVTITAVILLFLLVACGGDEPATDEGAGTDSVSEVAPESTAEPALEPTTAPDPTTAPAPEPTDAPETDESAEPVASEATESTTESQQAPAETTAVAGTACFASFGYGVTCLDETGWLPFSEANSGLGGNLIVTSATCGDEIYLAHSNGVSIFDGSSFRDLPAGWGSGGPDGIACDGNGGVWVAHFRGASYFDGSSWTTYGAENMSFGEDATDLVNDVAVAANGRVWISTASSVALFENETWTVFQAGQGFDERLFFEQIVLDSQGNPWALHSSGVATYGDGEWTLLQPPDLVSVEDMAIANNGDLWLGTFADGVYQFDGQSWTQYDTSNSGLTSNHVRSVAIDAAERIWLGTEWGLNVLDQGNWMAYHMDTSDLVDHDIYSIELLGTGPTLPSLIEKPAGSLSGIILADGQPLAEARIEVCVEKLGSRFFGETPCSDQPFFAGTETNADGSFTIDNLPAGFYIITLDTGDGNWAQLESDLGLTSERVPVTAGENTDVGELIVTFAEEG